MGLEQILPVWRSSAMNSLLLGHGPSRFSVQSAWLIILTGQGFSDSWKRNDLMGRPLDITYELLDGN